jgi:hypothetical protein
LFWKNGAVDQRLMREGGRMYPRPPAGITYALFAPVNGSCTVTLPTEGRALYVDEEKSFQMLFASAFVASGLQA